MVTIETCIRDGVLAYDTTIVLHFDLKIVVRQDLSAKVQDPGESAGIEPMVHDLRQPTFGEGIARSCHARCRRNQ